MGDGGWVVVPDVRAQEFTHGLTALQVIALGARHVAIGVVRIVGEPDMGLGGVRWVGSFSCKHLNMKSVRCNPAKTQPSPLA